MADEINKNQTATTSPQTNEVDPVFAQIEGELKTRFELLPTELQQVILSSDYQMKLFEVAKKHKLTYEKLGQLELETTMVILGMTPPDEYKAEVAEQMNLSGADLDNVVMEINEQVFQPIREKLMGIYSEEEVKKGEEFAQVTTNPNAVVEKTPIQKSPAQAPLSMAGVPTSTTNIENTKQEIPVAPPKPAAPIDPYREIPDATPVVNGPASPLPPTPQTTGATPVSTPVTGINTKLTDEFLKTIPVLDKNTKNKSDIEAARGVFVPEKNGVSQALRSENILETAKKAGGVETMPTKKPLTQSETLQNIADLKNTLSASLDPKPNPVETAPVTQTNPVAPTPVEPVVTTPPIQEQKTTPTVEPVVTKEIQSEKVATIVSSVSTQFAPLPNIVTKAPPVADPTSAEVKTTPKFSSEETGELVRNIKLQIDENKATEASPVAPETLQKIDSMIDFKKAGTFMNAKEGGIAHVGENFTGTTFQKPIVQTTTPAQTPTPGQTTPEKGHIFDKDINNLGAPVKKTGFFSKMKNFFSGKEKITRTETVQPAIKDTTVHQFSGMPTNMRPEEGSAPIVPPQTQTPVVPNTPPITQQPVPPGVDDVKIYDEVTVVKK